MMYEHIVARMKEVYEGRDVSETGRDHIAMQFNVWGEGHGALYLEIKDGRAYVEPYEYFDRDALITTDAQTLLGIADGKIDPLTYGDLYLEGDPQALEVLKCLSFKEDENKQAREDQEPEEKEAEAEPEKKKGKSRAETVKKKAGAAAHAVKKKAGGAAETVKKKAGSAAGSVRGKIDEVIRKEERKSE